MRVAIVHDWLVTYRGGEKVVEALRELFPDADVYTLFHDPSKMPATLRGPRIHCSPAWNLWRRLRKALFPLLPIAIESLVLKDCDLVISSSSCVAKGVIPPPGTPHISYVHSPMRYVWDQMDAYLGRWLSMPVVGFLIRILATKLRIWDQSSSVRVTQFVANSTFVSDRIQSFYGRSALVVAPPVDLAKFRRVGPGGSALRDGSHKKGRYYVVAGAFVSYKRFDVAIEAAQKVGVSLVVMGSGPEEVSLRRMAGPQTSFIIRPDDATWQATLSGAAGFLFPGIEDFGITAVEALSCGTPVIAHPRGGARDIVLADLNGLFAADGSVEAFADAIRVCESRTFVRSAVSATAERFSKENFLRDMRKVIDDVMEAKA